MDTVQNAELVYITQLQIFCGCQIVLKCVVITSSAYKIRSFPTFHTNGRSYIYAIKNVYSVWMRKEVCHIKRREWIGGEMRF
jgi:hypothetical protein